jgi:dTDP-4-dehydrorhamnose reductase
VSADLLRRVVVIGASGQLGSDLMLAFADCGAIGVDHAMVDIEKGAEVAALFAHHRPSLVINTAAYHNVERCETHADRAFAVNAIAVDGLAALCEASGAALGHISTDYVFDGRAKTPYDEAAAAAPLNVYGASKYAGELVVAARTARAFVFRTSGLYGVRGSSTKGHTFVERIREQALAGKPLRIVDDVTTAPSYTRDVARKIREIVATGRFGTYHVSNAGSCTWFDFATEILGTLALDADLTRTTTDAFPAYARRPAYSVLANNAADRAGLAPMQRWQDALADYLNARS